MKRTLACLLLAAVAAGQEDGTLAAMDAEVSGDWVRAVEGFRRAAGDRPDRLQRQRLKAALARAKRHFGEEIDAQIKAKQWQALARTAALARVVAPKYNRVTRALKLLARRGVAVPEVAPESRQAVAAFPHRSPGGRARCATLLGGDFARAEQVIAGCLDFLVRVQEEDGRWDCEKFGGKALYDPGVTALALMALLAEGPAALDGKRAEAIHRAAVWLKESRDRDGVFGGKRAQHFMYSLAFGTEALAEYALVTGHREEWKTVLGGAVGFVVAARNKGAGWRYEPGGGESDTSITWRCVSALTRARILGIDVPEAALRGARAWVGAMTDETYGVTGYNLKGGSVARPEGLQERFPSEKSLATTAAGVLVRIYTGGNLGKAAASIGMVREILPLVRYPDMYYWDVGTRMFKAAYGYVPRDWYAAVLRGVEACRDGDGSIVARGPWGADGGGIYATALCALALAAPYREPPPRRGEGLTASAFLRDRVRSVAVLGNAVAVPTGIYVDAGLELALRASGGVVAWANGPRIGPGGTGKPPAGRKRALRSASYGSLIGRVGPHGKLFPIGTASEIKPRATGQLYLMCNLVHPADGEKSWHVAIRLKP